MDDIFNLREVLETKDKQIEEYSFDSLCLRYKNARQAQAYLEVQCRLRDLNKALEACNIDYARFQHILKEVLYD